MNIITADEIRQWINDATDEDIEDFLDNGLRDVIEDLESDDYFGTEGFAKRYS